MTDINEWCFEGVLQNHKIVRKIRSSSKSTAYLAQDLKGNRFVLTYIESDKVFERMRFKAHQLGHSIQDADLHARKMLEDYMEEVRQMIERIKGLGSENVAVTYGIGQDAEKNLLAIVSEYTPGVDLLYATGGLKPLQMISLFTQALHGLKFIHSSGFLHLNVKPSRIRVDLEGVPPIVRLTDFGFAVPVDGWKGEYNGTALFMAPEVIREEREKIDERADLYSLGVTMYLSLTHRDPFPDRLSADGDRIKLKTLLNREAFPSPPSHFDKSVPKELDEIILDLIQSDSDKRSHRYTADLLHTFYDKWPEESRNMPHEDTSTLMENLPKFMKD